MEVVGRRDRAGGLRGRVRRRVGGLALGADPSALRSRLPTGRAPRGSLLQVEWTPSVLLPFCLLLLLLLLLIVVLLVLLLIVVLLVIETLVVAAAAKPTERHHLESGASARQAIGTAGGGQVGGRKSCGQNGVFADQVHLYSMTAGGRHHGRFCFVAARCQIDCDNRSECVAWSEANVAMGAGDLRARVQRADVCVF